MTSWRRRLKNSFKGALKELEALVRSVQVSVLDSEVTKKTTLLTETEEKVAQLELLMVSKEAAVRKMEERQAKQKEVEDQYRAQAVCRCVEPVKHFRFKLEVLEVQEKLRKTEEAFNSTHILKQNHS